MSSARFCANEFAPRSPAAQSVSVTMYCPATGRAFFLILVFCERPFDVGATVSAAAAQSVRARTSKAEILFIPQNLRKSLQSVVSGRRTRARSREDGTDARAHKL